MPENPSQTEAKRQSDIPSAAPQTLQQLKAYREWKQNTPQFFRNLVEGAMKNLPISVPKGFTPLVQQFYQALNSHLQNPQAQPSTQHHQAVQTFIAQLQNYTTEQGANINLLHHLTRSKVSWQAKRVHFQNAILPRLNWLANEDRQQSQSKKQESPDIIEQPPEQDELPPEMDGGEEGNEAPAEGFCQIDPYFGGYHLETLYDEWDATTKTWKKGTRTLTSVIANPAIQQGTERTDTIRITTGTRTPLPLSKHFAILPNSFQNLPQGVSVSIFQDQFGTRYLQTSGGNPGVKLNLSFTIGLRETPFKCTTPPTINPESVQKSALPKEVLTKIADTNSSSLPAVQKARIIAAFCRQHFTYSMDNAAANAACPPDENYFTNLWNHVHINCKPANTFVAEVLRQAGIPVMMATGHSIGAPTPQGTTLMHSGTGHAWLWAWSQEESIWHRIDATPAGDPNVNQEDQQQELDPEAPTDGDFPEQDAEYMSDEEVQEKIQEQDKTEQLKEMKEELQKLLTEEEKEELIKKLEEGATQEDLDEYKNKILKWKKVLQKILALRKRTNEKGQNIQQLQLNNWKKIVRTNLKEVAVDEGPVRQSQGSIINEHVVELRINALGPVLSSNYQGDPDPLGYEREETKVEAHKLFGGFEVYIAADGSTSQNRMDANTQQLLCEAQRDAVFLEVDSLMQQALESRRMKSRLRCNMPVIITVIIFGQELKIPLSQVEEWGPREQMAIYEALDARPAGSTPDHLALQAIRHLISLSKQKEEKERKRNPIGDPQQGRRKKHPPLIRFVLVFADGGSDEVPTVRQHLKEMRQDENLEVHGFGITKSRKPMEGTYAPDAQTVEDLNQLDVKVSGKLTERIKARYNIK